jgi:general secretion pathway protein G
LGGKMSEMKRHVHLRFVLLTGLITLGCAVLYLAIPYEHSVARAKEAVLRADLQEMRLAIRNFTADKKRAPKSLQELVDEKYLRSIPIDPMTGKRDWRISDRCLSLMYL